jgi:D-tyrosyl-tRNA(Tyr) deacylase
MSRVLRQGAQGLLRRRCCLQGFRLVHQRQSPFGTVRDYACAHACSHSVPGNRDEVRYRCSGKRSCARPRVTGANQYGNRSHLIVFAGLGVAGPQTIMRAVIQRVRGALVEVAGERVGEIGRGLAVLIGVTHEDSEDDAVWIARKIAELRIIADDEGRMNRSLVDTGEAALIVSQFTLFADTRSGRRPGFTGAALPSVAEPLVTSVIISLRSLGIPVATGRFGADMTINLVADGPVTILLDSAERPGKDGLRGAPLGAGKDARGTATA